MFEDRVVPSGGFGGLGLRIETKLPALRAICRPKERRHVYFVPGHVDFIHCWNRTSVYLYFYVHFVANLIFSLILVIE